MPASIIGKTVRTWAPNLLRKKCILFITGAGISTNSGIPDFRSLARSNKSGCSLYDASAYLFQSTRDQLKDDILGKLENGREASFTPFDNFANRLAESGRLCRHYTQNIDARQTRLSSLAEKTIWLHGRADTLVCHLIPAHTKVVGPKSFKKYAMTPCRDCKRLQLKRKHDRKRQRSLGILRPKVHLYGKESPDESAIIKAFNNDMREEVDAVVIIGTRLLIPSVLDFTKHLSKIVKARDPDNMVVWVNKEPHKLGSLISHQYLGDCDDFFSFLEDATTP